MPYRDYFLSELIVFSGFVFDCFHKHNSGLFLSPVFSLRSLNLRGFFLANISVYIYICHRMFNQIEQKSLDMRCTHKEQELKVNSKMHKTNYKIALNKNCSQGISYRLLCIWIRMKEIYQPLWTNNTKNTKIQHIHPTKAQKTSLVCDLQQYNSPLFLLWIKNITYLKILYCKLDAVSSKHIVFITMFIGWHSNFHAHTYVQKLNRLFLRHVSHDFDLFFVMGTLTVAELKKLEKLDSSK